MDLKIFHGVAGTLHLAQFAQAVTMSATLLEDKPGFQVTNDYYDHFNTKWSNKKVGDKYNLGYVVSAFPLLSAVNHFWALFDFNRYMDFVVEGYNPVRWSEYSVSAGVMLYLIGQLSGISNLGTLLAMGVANGGLQVQGLVIERQIGLFKNLPFELKGPIRDSLVWQEVSGFMVLLACWVPIFISFFTAISDSDDVPAFVYGIIFNLFFLFMVFGLISVAYLRGRTGKKVPRKQHYSFRDMALYDFRTTEKSYAILSLLAKTSLTQMTLFGILNMDE